MNQNQHQNSSFRTDSSYLDINNRSFNPFSPLPSTRTSILGGSFVGDRTLSNENDNDNNNSNSQDTLYPNRSGLMNNIIEQEEQSKIHAFVQWMNMHLKTVDYPKTNPNDEKRWNTNMSKNWQIDEEKFLED